jgi:antitoxin component YwqK of YwqJK toxin-antitoxin module
VGLSRAWYDSGAPRRATFYEGRQERASVEWNERGQLQDLRCFERPVLAPALDDRKLCGFSGESEVMLHAGNGELQSRLWLREGRRVKTESYWRNGRVQTQVEQGEGRRVERRFADDGTKRREIQAAASGTEGRLFKTLEQEFSERGTLVREQRWGERGALVSDVRYYLNGQPREKSEYRSEGGVELRVDTAYYDSGRVASEGRYIEQRGGLRGEPVGVHKRYDETGRLAAESIYDARGKLTRERVWDEKGALVRDDEVFEDGSRKAFSR